MAAGVVNGSSRANPQPIKTLRKSRWIPAAFSPLRSTDMTGEYPAGLLDIGGSLC
jgi:hypothetical protein